MELKASQKKKLILDYARECLQDAIKYNFLEEGWQRLSAVRTTVHIVFGQQSQLYKEVSSLQLEVMELKKQQLVKA
ncbi:hypothetical protein F6V25_07860 [Oryzomonas japonica]|uniref:Uncharacterized protein n=1 Tax=Oryzomonas japonica TaxID=2603858 RepID=A0A7J4ZR39_9BACT|nr:hypothetical protein [Oryzomonas japonica]KAB0665628.1 hypothetical protein F6V25_07860 [Oryzomonas japonica]